MSQGNAKNTDAEAPAGESFRLTLDGNDHSVPINAGETLLQAALAAGIDAPHNCTQGRCGSCMSWLRSGEVSMANTKALSKRKLERGYVLACQALPSTAENIWLDFDDFPAANVVSTGVIE